MAFDICSLPQWVSKKYFSNEVLILCSIPTKFFKWQFLLAESFRKYLFSLQLTESLDVLLFSWFYLQLSTKFHCINHYVHFLTFAYLQHLQCQRNWPFLIIKQDNHILVVWIETRCLKQSDKLKESRMSRYFNSRQILKVERKSNWFQLLDL